MRVRWVLPGILLLWMLTACESTERIISSTTSEEATPAGIVPPVVEEEEVLEPVVEEPEAPPTLAAPAEQTAEAPTEPTQAQAEPIAQEPSAEMEKPATVEAHPSVPEKHPPPLPTPQVPAPVEPQKTAPVEPVRPKKLQDIYFDFDQATIRRSAEPILEANAALLKTRYANRNLLLEGHCDERGSVEYNLVLGMRRAQVVKAYLVDLGVAPSRIRIVSYGKERPVCSQQNEVCWQRNRRTHFVLQ